MIGVTYNILLSLFEDFEDLNQNHDLGYLCTLKSLGREAVGPI